MNETIQALFDGADDGRLLEALYDAIEEAWGPCTGEGMPAEQQIFLLVYGASGLVSCGGLECFLRESPEDFEETVKAFEAVGAAESVANLRRVSAFFPAGRLPEGPLSGDQKDLIDREGGWALFQSDVVPELATWVRAHREAFADLPGTSFTKRYQPIPSLPVPPAEAGSREVAEWLHSRKVTLTCAESVHGSGVPRSLHPGYGLPDGPLTIVSLAFAYDRRDNAQTLEGLARWTGRSSLEQIHLEDCRLGASTLALIPRFPSVRVLNLTRARIRDDDVRCLASVSSLEELTLRGTRASDAGLRSLASLPKIRSLDIVGTQVRGSALGLFSALAELNLGNGRIEDSSLSFLENLRELTSVNVYSVPLARKAVERLASLPRLRELLIWDTGLAEHSLELLRAHPQLRTLNLVGMKLTAATARVLADIPKLEEIYVGDVEKPTEMIELLRELRPSLKTP